MKNRALMIGGGAALVVALVLAYAFIGSTDSAQNSGASVSTGDPADAFQGASGPTSLVREFSARDPSSDGSRLQGSETDTEGDATASGDAQAKAKKKEMNKRKRGSKRRQNDSKEEEQGNARKKIPLKTARGIPVGG